MSSQLIRVLLAVPTPDLRDGLEGALPRAQGYECLVVDSLETALTSGSARRSDIVLLELPHPGTGDLDAVGLALGSPIHLPVVVVTAPDDEPRALRAVQRGCADHFTTDHLHPELVRRVVRYAVGEARAERRREQAEQALIDSEQRYRSLFEQSRDAIYMTERDGEILELNRAALDLLGYQADELIGRDVRVIYADSTDRERFQEEIEEHGHVRDFEVRLRRKDGANHWCLLSSWVRRDPGGKVVGYQGIIHDIAERKRAENQLIHEAFHDSLTGLPNRALFMDRLERAVARRRRGEERELAVLFLDMDRFKVVNDSLGHHAGDELLRRMARLLSEEVREEDTVARMGGDEFAILLDGVDDPADPTHVAERIQARLRTPFQLHGQDVFSSMSIGITFGGAELGSPEQLLRNADTAMYRAKEMGPARYQIFDPAMHARAVSLLQLQTDLRLALDREEFVLQYQPLVELDSGRTPGFEALVRWDHPERGLLQPQSFIPIAEETGLIVPLGVWVLQASTRQLREWRAADPAFQDVYISVNLSARQFAVSDLADTVERILQEEGLDGSALRLEITESAMMRDPKIAIRALGRLRELGVTLCIDDFGTGYSSLSQLHELPVDILKIDRSFISRLGDKSAAQMVETILSLARNLGMDAVAEGVETEGQLARLRDLGSASVQGFLFSIPLDPDAARRFVQDHNRSERAR